MTGVDNRIAALHARMETRRHARERQKTAILGIGSGGLAICLVLLVFDGNSAHSAEFAGLYSGATMLFENAGGYVLTAVISFMAGVLITVLCFGHRNDNKR